MEPQWPPEGKRTISKTKRGLQQSRQNIAKRYQQLMPEDLRIASCRMEWLKTKKNTKANN